VIELVDKLYSEVDSIFKEYTTHQWKNGWQHEGDRESTELTIQKEIKWNNIFLVQQGQRGDGSFSVEGNSFDLEVSFMDGGGNDKVRVNIKKGGNQNHAYYYITEEKWNAHRLFVLDMCNKMYESALIKREFLDTIPEGIFGDINPPIFTEYVREENIKQLLEEND